MKKRAAWIGITTLVLAASACGHHESPTEPGGTARLFDVTGTWHGNLGDRHPTGEDWSNASVSLTQTGLIIHGSLTSVDGTRHPLGGAFSEGVAVVQIGGRPATSECSSAELSINQIEYASNGQPAALDGILDGRCFGTIMFPFRLTR
jgi:hypothetical protein